jgi:heptose-I-phosphate ethanolaminephosphotransferase
VNQSRSTQFAFAPAFAAVGWMSPGILEAANKSSVQDGLLAVVLSAVAASVVLPVYRWRSCRIALHVLLLVLPIELFYRIAYRGAVSPGVLLSVANTSVREAKELLQGHPGLTLALIVVCGLSVVALIACRNATNPFSLKRCTLVGAASALTMLGVLVVIVEKDRPIGEAKSIVREAAGATFPLDIADSLRVVVKGLLDVHNNAEAREHFAFKGVRAVESRAATPPEFYVIVIGEASRRENWSLYGYARATTPRLDAMRQELVVFDRLTSNATVTTLSIPLALTRATPSKLSPMHSEKSIIGLLRQGGYNTYWISNQDHFGRNENSVSAIASEANSVSFPETIQSGSERSLQLDSNLIPRLAEALAASGSGSKTVVFLHMMGSHYDYGKRHPADMKPFSTFGDLPVRLSRRQMQAVNEYDNSIYFSDYVLSRIIGMLSRCSCKAALLFFSDHGERLFDGGMGSDDFGHGFPTVSAFEIEIPFLAWFSRSYRVSNPDRVLALTANSQKAVELDDLFETIVDLTGLTYDERKASRSLFSRDLSPVQMLEVLNVAQKRILLVPEQKAIPDD